MTSSSPTQNAASIRRRPSCRSAYPAWLSLPPIRIHKSLKSAKPVLDRDDEGKEHGSVEIIRKSSTGIERQRLVHRGRLPQWPPGQHDQRVAIGWPLFAKRGSERECLPPAPGRPSTIDGLAKPAGKRPSATMRGDRIPRLPPAPKSMHQRDGGGKDNPRPAPGNQSSQLYKAVLRPQRSFSKNLTRFSSACLFLFCSSK